MGASTSTPASGQYLPPSPSRPSSQLPASSGQGQGQEPITNKLVVSDKVLEKLKQMNALLGQHKSNQTDLLLQDARAYAQRLNIKPEMIDQINGRVQKFKDILNKHGSSTVPESNEKLYEYFSLYNDKTTNSVTKLKEELLQEANNVIPSEAMRTELGAFVDKLVLLNQNNRFLEYKYISLNIFLIAILGRIFDAFFQFMEDVKNYNRLRTEAQTTSANLLVQKLLKIMEKAQIGKIDVKATDDINQSLEVLLKTIDDWKQQLDRLDDENRQKMMALFDEFTHISGNLRTDPMMAPGRGANVSPQTRYPPVALPPPRVDEEGSMMQMGSPISQPRSLQQQLPSPQFPAVQGYRPAAQLSADTPLFGNREKLAAPQSRSGVTAYDEDDEDGDYGLGLRKGRVGRGGDKKDKKTDKKQKGGYVRDGSKFPEEFYSKAS